MDSSTVRVKIEDLRQVANLLLDYSANCHGEFVDLEGTHFWSLAASDAFDLQAQPELTIGSVSESWQHLAKMLADNSEMVGYGLVWLADILRAAGNQTP